MQSSTSTLCKKLLRIYFYLDTWTRQQRLLPNLKDWRIGSSHIIPQGVCDLITSVVCQLVIEPLVQSRESLAAAIRAKIILPAALVCYLAYTRQIQVQDLCVLAPGHWREQPKRSRRGYAVQDFRQIEKYAFYKRLHTAIYRLNIPRECNVTVLAHDPIRIFSAYLSFCLKL